MNTGLLTVYNQEIVAIFAKNNREGKIPWFLNVFLKRQINFLQQTFQRCHASRTGVDGCAFEKNQ